MRARSIPRVLLDYVEGLKAHDVNRIADIVAEDLLFNSVTRILDKPQFLALLSALYAGFPDWRYEYDDIEDRGQGNYAIKWRQGGTHMGVWAMPGMGAIAPTGRKVSIPCHYFYYRIAGGALTIIFPEPIQGGAPHGILEQIGSGLPPLQERRRTAERRSCDATNAVRGLRMPLGVRSPAPPCGARCGP